MLTKCVNPFCHQPFRHLSRGKLFVVDFPRRATEPGARPMAGREHFWLCEECAASMTVAIGREMDYVRVKIINLPESGATKFDFRAVREMHESAAAALSA